MASVKTLILSSYNNTYTIITSKKYGTSLGISASLPQNTTSYHHAT